MSQLFHLALKSRNEKTGPIPVSTSPVDTCPDACPFKKRIIVIDDTVTEEGGGCYAAGGHLAMHWALVSAGKRGVSYDAFLASVSALPLLQLWRHDQAGDLPGPGDVIDVDALMRLVAANSGKRGFTYTHKPLSVPGNAAAIAAANAGGFTVNLSGNNLGHADELANAAVGPVVSVVSMAYQRRESGSGKNHQWLESLPEYRARIAALPQATPAGRPVAVCPATYLDDKSCANCALCAVRDRKVIVVFPAHGSGKAKAESVARA